MSYLFNILELGLIYSLLSLGVYITYGILNFPDLGIDGVICLGGAITACLINKNINVFVAMIISVFFGMIAGFVTGFLHVKFKINDLICGIITTTCLYSINLVIMNKKANLSLIGHDAIFSLSGLNFIPGKYKIIIIMLFMCVIIKLLVNFIMDSVFGLFLRCVGSNEKLVCAFGGNANKFKIIGLMISNGLVALCGSIIVQYQGFCDIGISIGALVLGLTMVILGLNINRFLKMFELSVCVMLGAILYEFIICLALNFGLDTIWLKFITGILLILILILKRGEKS
ncbi:MAG: ABC transporter permease [Firmicutes bacterium]|nr:ABC transporter permease [Bacillota bacterium]